MRFKVKREYLIDESETKIMTEEKIKENIPALKSMSFNCVDKIKIYLDFPEIITIKKL